MRLQNQKILVTGGAQGIGQGIALRLAEEGADIALNVRVLDERAASTRQRIEALGRRRVAVAAAVEQLGRLDVLVNNAGIEIAAGFLEVAEADYDRVMAVNLKGAFF